MNDCTPKYNGNNFDKIIAKYIDPGKEVMIPLIAIVEIKQYIDGVDDCIPVYIHIFKLIQKGYHVNQVSFIFRELFNIRFNNDEKAVIDYFLKNIKQNKKIYNNVFDLNIFLEILSKQDENKNMELISTLYKGILSSDNIALLISVLETELEEKLVSFNKAIEEGVEIFNLEKIPTPEVNPTEKVKTRPPTIQELLFKFANYPTVNA